jgi:hypothetical protein
MLNDSDSALTSLSDWHSLNNNLGNLSPTEQATSRETMKTTADAAVLSADSAVESILILMIVTSFTSLYLLQNFFVRFYTMSKKK